MYCRTIFNTRRGGYVSVDIGFRGGINTTWRAWARQRGYSEEAAWVMVMDPAEESAKGAEMEGARAGRSGCFKPARGRCAAMGRAITQ